MNKDHSHTSCNNQFDKFGGNVPCCVCTEHQCVPTIKESLIAEFENNKIKDRLMEREQFTGVPTYHVPFETAQSFILKAYEAGVESERERQREQQRESAEYMKENLPY